jgi:hypothetical protein
MKRISVEQQVKLEEGLRLYVQHHWTTQEFADYLGVSKNYAAKILKGDILPYVTRPPDLQYPSLREIDQSRLIPRAKVLEAFRRYKEEKWELMDFVSYLGVSPVTGYAIFRGEIYADIPRPERLDGRTVKQRTYLRAKQGLRLMIEHQWGLDRLKDFLEVDEMRSVYQLLERKTFPKLFDELKEAGWDVQAYVDTYLQEDIKRRKARGRVFST